MLASETKERIQKDKDGKVTTISGGIHYIIKSSYFISNAEDEKPVHLLSLILRNRKEDKSIWHVREIQHPQPLTIQKGISIPFITFPGNPVCFAMFVRWWTILITYMYVSYVISLSINDVSTYHMS